MNKDSAVGRIMTIDEAMLFWARCQEAEKVMGPLDREERMVILGTIGTELTLWELKELMAGKRVLIVKEKDHDKPRS